MRPITIAALVLLASSCGSGAVVPEAQTSAESEVEAPQGSTMTDNSERSKADGEASSAASSNESELAATTSTNSTQSPQPPVGVAQQTSHGLGAGPGTCDPALGVVGYDFFDVFIKPTNLVSICVVGFDMDSDVDLEILYPDETIWRVTLRPGDHDKMYEPGHLAVVMFTHRDPLGEYQLFATQGPFSASGYFVLESPVDPVAGLVPMSTADELVTDTNLFDDGQAPVFALAGFRPGEIVDLHLYRSLDGNDADYVKSTSVTIDDWGGFVGEVSQFRPDGDGLYCIEIENTVMYHCGWTLFSVGDVLPLVG